MEKSFPTEENDLIIINRNLNSEDIIVNYINGRSEEGFFLRINNDFLLIKRSSEIREIPINDIHSIEYQEGSILLGSTLGALAGFVAGALIANASGATLNFGGGSENTEYFLAIPIFTLGGAIWGGIEGNEYSRIEFKDSTNLQTVVHP